MDHQPCKFPCIYFLFLCLHISPAFAQSSTHLSGKVTDARHRPLAYAGVYVVETGAGTTTDVAGQYFLDLPPGTYRVVCRYLGYEKQQKATHVDHEPVVLDFQMHPLSLAIGEVVIHGGEDPAYAIIKKAIQKREFYENQEVGYRCKVYVKGVATIQDAPPRLLGTKIDYSSMHLDSTHSGIFFVSESWSNLQVDTPHRLTQEVIASRQSGGGLGFDFPVFIDFYRNNVSLGSRRLTPRGYISPIANHALHYYRYHLAGTFTEDGNRVYKIQVQPKRRHEPLFSGYINILDSSWRIHSLDLKATREQALQLMDSLEVRQLHGKISSGVWRLTNQSLTFGLRQFGFPLHGIFRTVYADYRLHPEPSPNQIGVKIRLWYDSLADQRSTAYWDRIRPIPLEVSEQADFQYKDSLALAAKDTPKKGAQSLRLGDLLWRGHLRKPEHSMGITLQWSPLWKALSYNTVEGLVTQAEVSWHAENPSGTSWSIAPTIRYGWNNHHFNAFIKAEYSKKKQFGTRWALSGGKRISQLNPKNPIDPIINSLYTLLAKENYLKIYENYFFQVAVSHRYLSGVHWQASMDYEDRHALHNTSTFSLVKDRHKSFLPNQPYTLSSLPFKDHRALRLSLYLSYQPGLHYIEYPDELRAIPSKAPLFSVGYSKGISGLWDSRANYDKWYINEQQKVNLNLLGTLKYKVQIGGFLNHASVSIADMTHFMGNQTLYTPGDLRFELMPYYAYSNDASFYSTGNLEYHLNGLLTDKIPLLNRLQWHLVVGASALYVNEGQHYVEAFAGLENIARLFRMEMVTGFPQEDKTLVGLRIGLGGLLSGALFQRDR